MDMLKARFESIVSANNIGVSIPNVVDFTFKNFNIPENINGHFSKPLRLGKQIENYCNDLLNYSKQYDVLIKGLQIKDEKRTVGELDFIVNDIVENQNFHLELVYKFYVYDPNKSLNQINNWIGPNRKDSLVKKLQKLKQKQFPLLNDELTQKYLEQSGIWVSHQRLCFMANLFVPHDLEKSEFNQINNNAITGIWFNLVEFEKSMHTDFEFYLPQKSEWGIDPKFDKTWFGFNDIIKEIKESLNRSFSPLVWIKKPNQVFEQCFVVWW